MSLLALQTAFQAFVRDTDADDGDFAARLATPPGGNGRRRMGVYHHAYRARCAEVLREVFDKTWSYLGDAEFDAAAADYVERHASTSHSLDDYGADFPDHVARRSPGETDVAELAWLDWAMRRAFDAPDGEPIDVGRLAALDGQAWDRVGFVLHPGLTMRAVTTNVGALWAGLDAGSPLMPAPLPGPMTIRVWRKELQPHFRMIEPAEAGALTALSEGERFSLLCERLALDRAPDPVERAAAMLAIWLEDGLIIGLRGD